MWNVIIDIIGAGVVVTAIITVIASLSTGGLDDVDTRGPRRKFPK